MLIERIFSRLMPLSHRLRAGMLLLAFCSLSAHAAVVAVVLSEDSAPYHEASEAIESALKPQHTVIEVLSASLGISGSVLARADLLITVGVKAAERIAAHNGSVPVLSVLVPENWYRSRGREKFAAMGHKHGVVVLEQPLQRQMRLIRQAFPNAARVGVVLGPESAGLLDDLRAAARQAGLDVIGAVAESESSLVSTLSRVLKDADLLLAIPDAEVLNRNTVQSVLMTSYHYRDPVVGYSKALSRAGALVSLYSTPAQIGRQSGEIAARVLDGGRLAGQQWPKYFSVSVNGHVARSLGIAMPPEDVLMRELGNRND
ncbi:MAG: ABC transporter substrate binding protein [Pseudomonadota bacterium]